MGLFRGETPLQPPFAHDLREDNISVNISPSLDPRALLHLPYFPCSEALFLESATSFEARSGVSPFYSKPKYLSSLTTDPAPNMELIEPVSATDSAIATTPADEHAAGGKRPFSSFSTPSPPSSRPPSRNHTAKRPRPQRSAIRPTYVTEKQSSIRLEDTVEATCVDILWPGAESLESNLSIGAIISGSLASTPRRRFSVLCFLGCTIEHLHSLSLVSSLLSTLDANIFGVSLQSPPPHTSSLPIIYDNSRSLTLSLGLLHPLGGGRQALDAIVVLDAQLRRRITLPIGWGIRHQVTRRSAGRESLLGLSVDGAMTQGDEDGEGEVQAQVNRIVKGVEWLHGEEVDDRWG